MKKLALLLCLGLAACSTNIQPAEISARAKQIQDYTRLACKFVPTVATIASILTSGASAAASVIATDICNAVTTAPLADGGKRDAYYNAGGKNIKIEGRFVR